MSDSWTDRVDQYVQQLELIALSIERVVAKCQVDTTQVATEQVESHMNELTLSLQHLEESIAAREALLQDPIAPPQGNTLSGKLRHVPGQDALVQRCEEVASRIAQTNQSAVSLFVCQYHLAEFSGELVRLITGEVAPPTYNAALRAGEYTPNNTGGLLNEEG